MDALNVNVTHISVQDPRQVGSLRYMAPEILEGSANLAGGRGLLQADVYSLGLLLWEIWTRCADLCPGEGHGGGATRSCCEAVLRRSVSMTTAVMMMSKGVRCLS